MRGKYLLSTILLFICCKSFATYNYFSELLDNEEPPVSLHQSKFQDKTKDALLSYDFVDKRAKYFTFKLKNLTFGDYSDQVLYAAPLITGKVEFSIKRVHFYYDHNANKTGFKYKLKF